MLAHHSSLTNQEELSSLIMHLLHTDLSVKKFLAQRITNVLLCAARISFFLIRILHVLETKTSVNFPI
jgi:hypothetical protein